MMIRYVDKTEPRRSFRSLPLLASAVLLMTLAGCNTTPRTTQQEDADIQRRSAEAAARFKAGAEKAAVMAKPAIKSAARRLKDVAVGVKQGIKSDPQNSATYSKPSAGRLDLNSATASQLAALPGISADTADAIVAARPYTSPRQLVRRKIVTNAEYQRISGRLTAR